MPDLAKPMTLRRLADGDYAVEVDGLVAGRILRAARSAGQDNSMIRMFLAAAGLSICLLGPSAGTVAALHGAA